jgi:peptidoglycan-associated lipoprotein
MRLKFFALVAFGLFLAACGSTPDESADVTGSGASPPPTTAVTAVAPAPDAALDPASQEYLVVNIGDRVFFDFDRSDLKPEAQSLVENVAVWMKSNPSVVLNIEGHCDERGTREYNLALGERRANSVYEYLLALGIDSGRLTNISYGKERPAVLGSYEEAWSQNRRGVFVVN